MCSAKQQLSGKDARKCMCKCAEMKLVLEEFKFRKRVQRACHDCSITPRAEPKLENSFHVIFGDLANFGIVHRILFVVTRRADSPVLSSIFGASLGHLWKAEDSEAIV